MCAAPAAARGAVTTAASARPVMRRLSAAYSVWGSPSGAVPEPRAEARGARDRALDGRADGCLGADQDELAAGPGDRRVEQLPREHAGARVGQEHGGRLVLGALALVDGHRVDRVDRR